MKLPQLYRESIVKEERRRLRAEEIQQLKTERFIQSEAVKKQRELKMREERQKKLKAAVEMARLRDQARRNSARARQEVAEMMAYEKQYGEVLKLNSNTATLWLIYVLLCSLEDSWHCGIASRMKFITGQLSFMSVVYSGMML